MQVENGYGRALGYVDALIGEIALHGAALEGRGRLVSVHFGGGSPNYLSSADIARILSAIESHLGLTDSAHLSIELDPRSWRSQDVSRLVSLGFDRFSLGVQDFDPDAQAAASRMQSFDLVEECVCEVRSAGAIDLSFDMPYGLPRQTIATFSDTLEKVIALGPDRVAVCGYAPSPMVFPRQQVVAEREWRGARARAAMAALADGAFSGAGYRRIGFDHYAKPGTRLAQAAAGGRLKRIFQGFSEEPSPTILAAGASAISFVESLYAQNEKNVGAYITRVKGGRSPVVRGLVRTRREEVVATAIGDLLCGMAVDVAPLLREALPAEALRICAALERLESDGAILWDGDRVSMAEGAFMLARAVASTFDPYAATAGGLSRAV